MRLKRARAGTPDDKQAERGQALIIFVLVITVVFVIGVIVIDVGFYLSHRRHAQTAADLAALAAAAKLDESNAATITKGKEFAMRNGFDDAEPDVEVVVTPGYNGDPEQVEVTISDDTPSLLGGIFGLLGLDVGARAVAALEESPPTPGFPAIWANSSACGPPEPLEISGSDNVVTGETHSNGGAKVNGSNNEFNGGFEYRAACDLDLSGSGNDFDPPADDIPAAESMPIDYDYDDFDCDFEYFTDTNLVDHDELWVNDDPDTNELRELVICSTADLVLSGQDITGTVTLVAGDELKVSGSDFHLTGSEAGFNVLFYSSATHDSAIDISGSGGEWIGYIHAPNPNALIKIQGSDDLSVHGSVIGHSVRISGSNFSITAEDDPNNNPVPPTVKLVE